VAVWPQRAAAIEPVALNFPVAGSYSSAVEVGNSTLPVRTLPPATRTRPSLSRVAVGPSRPTVIELVRVNSTAGGIGVGSIDGVGVEDGVAVGVAVGTEIGGVADGEGDVTSVAVAEAEGDGPVTPDGVAVGVGPMVRKTSAAMRTATPAAMRPNAGRHGVPAVAAKDIGAESSARATRVSSPEGGSPSIDW